MAADRGVDYHGQGFSGEVVDDAQDAAAPALGQGVGDEVQTAALVRTIRQGHGRTGSRGSFATPPSAHGQALLVVEPEQLLLFCTWPGLPRRTASR